MHTLTHTRRISPIQHLNKYKSYAFLTENSSAHSATPIFSWTLSSAQASRDTSIGWDLLLWSRHLFEVSFHKITLLLPLIIVSYNQNQSYNISTHLHSKTGNIVTLHFTYQMAHLLLRCWQERLQQTYYSVVQSYSPIANTDSCLASKTSSLPPEHIIFILYSFLANAVVKSWGNEKLC